MKVIKFFSTKSIIIIGAAILIAYLGLILTVTHFGQSKLQKSQVNVLQLEVSQYVKTIEFILSVSQQYVIDLEDDKTVSTFFANLHSGMSMEYGLGSSLTNLQRQLGSFVVNSQLDEHKIFNRVVLIDLSGNAIADTHTDLFFDKANISKEKSLEQQSEIFVVEGSNGLKIQLHKTVFHQRKPVGVFVADLNLHLVINQLKLQNTADRHSRLQLTAPNGKSLLIWDSISSDNKNNLTLKPELANNIAIDNEIAGVDLYLESWFEPIFDQDILTSSNFTLILSFLAIPLLFGLYYLLKIDKSNTILRTQINVSVEEQDKLSQQNVLLEREIKRRKQSESQLAYQATHDELTGLVNRNVSHTYLSQTIQQSQINNTEILVMFIDLDNFKKINDTLGHAAGDDILKMASRRLLDTVYETDMVARLGGDEFLLIAQSQMNIGRATDLATKILSIFDEPFIVNDFEFFITASIGMSMYPMDGYDPETLLKNADMALYRVKDSGRNDFSFYDSSLNESLQQSVLLDKRLRLAINNNDIEMYYQPIIELKSGKIVAAEALMRWHDNELGFVAPDIFIPLAEKNGLIHQLGELALLQACYNTAEWQEITPINIAVNFSSVQFRYCNALLEKIETALNESQLPADKLTIEITESLLIDHNKDLLNMLNKVDKLGIGLSIDDFGVGYSSLSYLQKFPFSKLKIDKAFMDGLQTNAANRSLVTAIFAMANALNLKVIAEGIEEPYQAKYLADMKCEFGQGYLFSKAVTADEFKQLLLKDKQHPLGLVI
ncbi:MULTISPECIES: putative bifunctional diguanylate cyclase/phosphodiesterase [unclassified Shewanella]|uniref:putative bifunctional diguanylate cyclase/phosphodiesterase n=1 Tax=unclassified Shewanella TaxID=196818 RepID=UPI000C8653FB|nr:MULTISPECIES: EAL domain-containing protein [unclassified Shewanella]MDO6639456.1 EAL domain-containing protein [Shewanella sp. 5_MG-2023]MDO6678219.1 EAL domain-containing protein [Shewanella sp. 4_MG-2023]PMH85452.1 diguanylate cyclase [Shewanella sp. 10N.286.48.B5]PMH96285.1 diguanylate cyclase [Shewanella sp. 10N.286.48.A6]